ncbi:MAG: hypothetical protein EOO94_04890 [Pedobacter sp.]|nr:MAG: hypothetical protein EOO94_04890 [Pedobacter sp.]
MKIYNVPQIRDWDQFTITNEPVSSLNLMERAAGKCFDWLMANGYRSRAFAVFCGTGNNGGDGLVIARLLIESAHAVVVYIFETDGSGTEDYQYNLSRITNLGANVVIVKSNNDIHIADLIPF